MFVSTTNKKNTLEANFSILNDDALGSCILFFLFCRKAWKQISPIHTSSHQSQQPSVLGTSQEEAGFKERVPLARPFTGSLMQCGCACSDELKTGPSHVTATPPAGEAGERRTTTWTRLAWSPAALPGYVFIYVRSTYLSIFLCSTHVLFLQKKHMICE